MAYLLGNEAIYDVLVGVVIAAIFSGPMRAILGFVSHTLIAKAEKVLDGRFFERVSFG